MEKRQQPRFTSHFRSTISGGQREGQGRTLDLSTGGCKIETDLPVVVGMRLSAASMSLGLTGLCGSTKPKCGGSRPGHLGSSSQRFSPMRRQNSSGSLPVSTKNLRRSLSHPLSSS